MILEGSNLLHSRSMLHLMLINYSIHDNFYDTFLDSLEKKPTNGQKVFLPSPKSSSSLRCLPQPSPTRLRVYPSLLSEHFPID